MDHGKVFCNMIFLNDNRYVYTEANILGSDLALPVDKNILFHFKKINEGRIELKKLNLDSDYWESILVNIMYQIKNLTFLLEE